MPSRKRCVSLEQELTARAAKTRMVENERKRKRKRCESRDIGIGMETRILAITCKAHLIHRRVMVYGTS